MAEQHPAGPEAGPGAAYPSVEALLRARLAAAFGGWRGAVESAVPTLLFVIAWNVTSDVRVSALVAVAAAALVAVIRLVQGSTLRYVALAVLGVAIAAFFAARTGRAQDAFLPGMIQSGATGLLFAVTNLIRWPIFGFLIAAGDPELEQASIPVREASSRSGRAARGRLSAAERAAAQAADEADAELMTEALTAWRRHDGIVRVAARLGWVLVGLAAFRLSIQVPLYLQGHVEALGIAKVVLGWPAYALAVVIAVVLVLGGHTPLDQPAKRASTPPISDEGR